MAGKTKEPKSFYRIPAVVLNQGPQTKELSQRRQNEWLSSQC